MAEAVSLDDIWDVPADAHSSSHVDSSGNDAGDDDDDVIKLPKRTQPSQKLFLDSDSDDDLPAPSGAASGNIPKTPARSTAPDIDHLFADLGDDDAPESAPRRIDPVTPHAILPSSSPPREVEDTDNKKSNKSGEAGAEKKRKPMPKLDETRLLGPDGFPALIARTKGFKAKGKGHEQEDLNRVLQMYQFWAHQLYPKTQFRDTVRTVEKLCHSKRMHVALSVWRDQAKGTSMAPEDLTLGDIPSDDDNIANGLARPMDHPPPSSSGASSPAARSSPTPASRTRISGLSHSELEGEPEEWDIDDLIRENEQRSLAHITNARADTSALRAPSSVAGIDDDIEFWEQLAAGTADEVNIGSTHGPTLPREQAAPSGTTSKPSLALEEDGFAMDEDAWDAMDAMEHDASKVAKASSSMMVDGAPAKDDEKKADAPRPMTDEEEWESMYA